MIDEHPVYMTFRDVGNYFDEFLDNYFGGVLLGAPIAGIEELQRWNNARKAEKNGTEIDYSGLSKHIINDNR